jgi:hypothetical protein
MRAYLHTRITVSPQRSLILSLVWCRLKMADTVSLRNAGLLMVGSVYHHETNSLRDLTIARYRRRTHWDRQGLSNT